MGSVQIEESSLSAGRQASEKPRLPGLAPLARLLRPVHRHLFICAALSAAAAGAGLVPYIAVAELARAVLPPNSPASVANVAWASVGIGAAGAALRLVLVFLSSRIGHYADAEMLHHIRSRLIRHLGQLPLGWFRARGSGAVKKAMTDDLEEMHQLIAHALGEMIGASVAIIAGLGYLAFVDWRMTVVTAAVLASMCVFYRIAMRSMTHHILRLIAAEEKISAASVEYADGISVVKAFGTSGKVLDRFAEAVLEYKLAMRDWVLETRFSSAASRLLASEMTVLGAVMIVGLPLIAAGHLNTSSLLPFLIVGIGLPTSITPAVQGSQGLRKGRVSAAHIESLLSRAPLPEADEPLRPHGHHIEFDEVRFSYDGKADAIAEFSAICEPGTVTAIVGPSGAGKTTIASLLPRFYDVTGGAIRIGGVDLRSMDAATLLSSMSLVFQDIVLLRDTVTENIRIGRPNASDKEVRAAARAARIEDVIERLPQGFDTLLGAQGTGLSGGERQRLTIARAILSRAPIVVLDEATASLDPDSEVAVQEALAELTRGKTVIVIAHRLHTVMGADQILVLDHGRVIERGTHEALLGKGGLYARLWAAQHSGAQQ
ncbi:ATP-binding cassette subfamily B protein [Sinorhizobium terangae]|uniref:ATP-binding cassette domain-containing protein n=1 Tax=Sinorhizobium terangae TaxID=110322 RepID=A0A6N7LHS2_SINTE|nr:ABC transporter ATP-binding protein [Sinorhizobium terangae]MBB4188977.1 ATP-binding cassette subfamily B protein [Sinorhizobium terangae]MQX16758.1 ATP-binding cassette domain-containing protein [Sinorhizobium terangae]